MKVKCANCKKELVDAGPATLSVSINFVKHYVCSERCQMKLEDTLPGTLMGTEMHFPQLHGEKGLKSLPANEFMKWSYPL